MTQLLFPGYRLNKLETQEEVNFSSKMFTDFNFISLIYMFSKVIFWHKKDVANIESRK